MCTTIKCVIMDSTPYIVYYKSNRNAFGIQPMFELAWLAG